jgi:hypothetical protein
MGYNLSSKLAGAREILELVAPTRATVFETLHLRAVADSTPLGTQTSSHFIHLSSGHTGDTGDTIPVVRMAHASCQLT